MHLVVTTISVHSNTVQQIVPDCTWYMDNMRKVQHVVSLSIRQFIECTSGEFVASVCRVDVFELGFREWFRAGSLRCVGGWECAEKAGDSIGVPGSLVPSTWPIYNNPSNGQTQVVLVNFRGKLSIDQSLAGKSEFPQEATMPAGAHCDPKPAVHAGESLPIHHGLSAGSLGLSQSRCWLLDLYG